MKQIKIVFSVVLLFVCIAVYSQTADESVPIIDDQNEEALFGGNDTGTGESVVTEITAKDTTSGIENVLLTSAQLQWSGKLTFAFQSSWVWSPAEALDFAYLGAHLTSPDKMLFLPSLGYSLAFDARPDANFRVLGKADITFKDIHATPEDMFQIRELFADYNWDNLLFFRIGKHTVKWGVGYFFSPADIINITPIDPADPEAEREGPLSIKINYPFGLNNLYLYVIANAITKPEGIAFAPKLEWLWGDMEIGLGGFYRPDMTVRPRVMATTTFKLYDFDVFGEVVASYGSERNFMQLSAAEPAVIEVLRKEEIPFFDATLGLRYAYDNTDLNLHLALAGQYLYNGDGYTDTSLFLEHSTEINMLLLSGTIAAADLRQPAQHYAALTGSWREIFGSDATLGCSWIASVDGSGSVSPSLSWTPDDNFSLTLRVPFTYGTEGCEFTPRGTTVTPDLSISLFEKTKISLQLPLGFSKDDTDAVIWKSGTLALGFSLQNGGF